MTEATETDENEELLEELRVQLATLTEENDKRKMFMASKYEQALSPSTEVNIRLNCTLAAILNEEHRIRIEIMTQTMLANIIDSQLNQWESKAARSELTRGIPGLDPDLNG